MDEDSWKKELKRQRRELRANLTPTELRMWEMLKGRRFHGYRWRRQANVGGSIVDYYCPKAKVVVELDGPGHMRIGTHIRDVKRTRRLEEMGIKVLRFRNPRILTDWERVEKTILEELERRCPNPYRNGDHP